MFWFLVLVFGVVTIVLALLAVSLLVTAVVDKRRYGKAFPTSGMSEPARALFREYMALPKDSRPFPDVISVLKGLDESRILDKTTIREHFNDNHYVRDADYKFNWTAASCSHTQRTRCKATDYMDMHKAIEEVSRAIADKEHVLVKAKIAGRDDAAKQLIEALRSEAQIQREVTREVSHGAS